MNRVVNLADISVYLIPVIGNTIGLPLAVVNRTGFFRKVNSGQRRRFCRFPCCRSAGFGIRAYFFAAVFPGSLRCRACRRRSLRRCGRRGRAVRFRRGRRSRRAVRFRRGLCFRCFCAFRFGGFRCRRAIRRLCAVVFRRFRGGGSTGKPGGFVCENRRP